MDPTQPHRRRREKRKSSAIEDYQEKSGQCSSFGMPPQSQLFPFENDSETLEGLQYYPTWMHEEHPVLEPAGYQKENDALQQNDGFLTSALGDFIHQSKEIGTNDLDPVLFDGDGPHALQKTGDDEMPGTEDSIQTVTHSRDDRQAAIDLPTISDTHPERSGEALEINADQGSKESAIDLANDEDDFEEDFPEEMKRKVDAEIAEERRIHALQLEPRSGLTHEAEHPLERFAAVATKKHTGEAIIADTMEVDECQSELTSTVAEEEPQKVHAPRLEDFEHKKSSADERPLVVSGMARKGQESLLLQGWPALPLSRALTGESQLVTARSQEVLRQQDIEHLYLAHSSDAAQARHMVLSERDQGLSSAEEALSGEVHLAAQDDVGKDTRAAAEEESSSGRKASSEDSQTSLFRSSPAQQNPQEGGALFAEVLQIRVDSNDEAQNVLCEQADLNPKQIGDERLDHVNRHAREANIESRRTEEELGSRRREDMGSGTRTEPHLEVYKPPQQEEQEDKHHISVQQIEVGRERHAVTEKEERGHVQSYRQPEQDQMRNPGIPSTSNPTSQTMITLFSRRTTFSLAKNSSPQSTNNLQLTRGRWMSQPKGSQERHVQGVAGQSSAQEVFVPITRNSPETDQEKDELEDGSSRQTSQKAASASPSSSRDDTAGSKTKTSIQRHSSPRPPHLEKELQAAPLASDVYSASVSIFRPLQTSSSLSSHQRVPERPNSPLLSKILPRANISTPKQSATGRTSEALQPSPGKPFYGSYTSLCEGAAEASRREPALSVTRSVAVEAGSPASAGRSPVPAMSPAGQTPGSRPSTGAATSNSNETTRGSSASNRSGFDATPAALSTMLQTGT